MTVLLVVTEHPPFLTDEAVRHYEAVRDRLARAAGTAVASAHYADATLDTADVLVLSGSRAPWAAHDRRALDRLRTAIGGFAGPVLGICAGMQLLATAAGGSVRTTREPAAWVSRAVEVVDDSDLLRGLPRRATFAARHTDEVVALPDGFAVLARSAECGVEAIADRGRRWWGTQFHPERFSAEHPDGETVLRNFFALAL